MLLRDIVISTMEAENNDLSTAMKQIISNDQLLMVVGIE